MISSTDLNLIPTEILKLTGAGSGVRLVKGNSEHIKLMGLVREYDFLSYCPTVDLKG